MGEIKQFFSLRIKLFLSFFLLSALITLAISYKLFVHMRTDHLNTLKRGLTVIADLAIMQDEGKRIPWLILTGKGGELANQAVLDLQNRLIGQGLNIDQIKVWRLDQSGEYIEWADSQNTSSRTEEFKKAAQHKSLLPQAITGPFVAEVPNHNLELVAYAPLKDRNGTVVALIGITVNRAAVAQDLRHFVIQVISVAALAILVVGIISWWLARNFSHRLSRLHAAMDEMAAGNLNISLRENGRDELSLLTDQLNKLAKSLASEREEMLLSAIESLVAALEAKDAYTYGHSSQVSAMAAAIGKQIGVGEKDLFSIRVAALLHDIGKIGIPDHVLNKPGRLDEEERRLIEQHPEIGARILSGIPALAQVTEIVKHHHARWDGKGYPEAIAGEAIPLGARIIAVADTYQAMTSDRPYRQGLNSEIAVAELNRCANSQFDPLLVTAFLKILFDVNGQENNIIQWSSNQAER